MSSRNSPRKEPWHRCGFRPYRQRAAVWRGKIVTPVRRSHLVSLAETEALAMRWIVTILIVLILTGCTMGPNYTRPEQPRDEAWRVSPATSESIANLRWWELLRDPTLQGLIQTALSE